MPIRASTFWTRCEQSFPSFCHQPSTLILFVLSNFCRLDSRNSDASFSKGKKQDGWPVVSSDRATSARHTFLVFCRSSSLVAALLRRPLQTRHFACPLVSHDRLHCLLSCLKWFSNLRHLVIKWSSGQNEIITFESRVYRRYERCCILCEVACKIHEFLSHTFFVSIICRLPIFHHLPPTSALLIISFLLHPFN
jgi:hypothetical protein